MWDYIKTLWKRHKNKFFSFASIATFAMLTYFLKSKVYDKSLPLSEVMHMLDKRQFSEVRLINSFF